MAKQLRSAGIAGLGMYVPTRVLTNADLERMVETSDEWITSRTGIKERRIVGPEDSTTTLSVLRGGKKQDLKVVLGTHVLSKTEACDVESTRPELQPYLGGKRLVTHQSFRELFRAESIPSEGGLEFKSMTVLFTDLKGSTELYERIGDFRAYGLVREHFQLLRDIIASRGGSMVKTIGDAVMASFAEPTPALEAAAAMTREVRKVGRDGADLRLKVGLHTGPCIAVELNERLDYFGQTVNIAARVQGVAQASEIVITEPVHAAPGAQEVIRTASLHASKEQASLKGVEGQVTVYRLR